MSHIRHVAVSAVVSAVVAGLILMLFPGRSVDDGMISPPSAPEPVPAAGPDSTAPAAPVSGPALSVTDPLAEDVWVDGSRQPGDDHRILTSAENSVCFLTKIEISGIASPDDSSACTIQVDEFTGFWDLVVSVPEGSQSHVRCNARCLTWE